MEKIPIVLKITGELFLDTHKNLTQEHIHALFTQIQQLPRYQFGIVIGGGNFFRGSSATQKLGLSITTSHQIGMLATLMNGLMMKDIAQRIGLCVDLFSALPYSMIEPITPDNVKKSIQKGNVIIFAGGTGNPFFTTDTAAILRALEMHADMVWKGTLVDGAYTADPRLEPSAQKLPKVSYKEAIELQLGVMDITAYAMAASHNIHIRIFNVFEKDALLKVAHDTNFGSTIS